MSRYLPQPFDPHAPVFSVSVAAALADMHPQTLRGYDRLGLVVPRRAKGRGRRYSMSDVSKLRRVQQLSQEGVNLEGVRRVLALESELESTREQVARMGELLGRIHADCDVGRLFTSAPDGVHLGRVRPPRPPRELTRSPDEGAS